MADAMDFADLRSKKRREDRQLEDLLEQLVSKTGPVKQLPPYLSGMTNRAARNELFRVWNNAAILKNAATAEIDSMQHPTRRMMDPAVLRDLAAANAVLRSASIIPPPILSGAGAPPAGGPPGGGGGGRRGGGGGKSTPSVKTFGGSEAYKRTRPAACMTRGVSKSEARVVGKQVYRLAASAAPDVLCARNRTTQAKLAVRGRIAELADSARCQQKYAILSQARGSASKAQAAAYQASLQAKEIPAYLRCK